MRKFLVLVFLIILVMTLIGGCSPARKPSQDIGNLISSTQQSIGNGSWNQASKQLEQINQLWANDKPRYQLNQDSQTINQFEKSLQQMEALISSQDKTQALSENSKPCLAAA